jgi:hypothetical protein
LLKINGQKFFFVRKNDYIYLVIKLVMENNRAHEIIVEVLQKALVGKLCANINLHDIADAIAAKVEFEKSYTTSKSDKIFGTIIDKILTLQDEAIFEMSKTSQDEKLLRNFIQGKITAYNEILDIINML